jgi:hypothetical protein
LKINLAKVLKNCPTNLPTTTSVEGKQEKIGKTPYSFYFYFYPQKNARLIKASFYGTR